MHLANRNLTSWCKVIMVCWRFVRWKICAVGKTLVITKHNIVSYVHFITVIATKIFKAFVSFIVHTCSASNEFPKWTLFRSLRTTVPVRCVCPVPVRCVCTFPVRYVCTVPVRCVSSFPVRCVCAVPVRCVCTVPVGCVCTVPVGCVCTVPVGCVFTAPVGCVFTAPVRCVCTVPVRCVSNS